MEKKERKKCVRIRFHRCSLHYFIATDNDTILPSRNNIFTKELEKMLYKLEQTSRKLTKNKTKNVKANNII